jgi:hypothetical protein
VISDSLDIISCFIIFFSSSNFFESVSSLSPIDWIFSLKLCFSSRNSLFELTRQNGDCLLRESRLVERTNREHGASIEVKLSDDIYMLFHYLEGTF